MATTIPSGVPTDVTLAAASAVETLTLPAGAKWLILWACTVDVSIVTVAGGTATANGRLVPTASIAGGYPIDISPFGFVGLAGASAATCRVEVR